MSNIGRPRKLKPQCPRERAMIDFTWLDGESRKRALTESESIQLEAAIVYLDGKAIG